MHIQSCSTKLNHVPNVCGQLPYAIFVHSQEFCGITYIFESISPVPANSSFFIDRNFFDHLA